MDIGYAYWYVSGFMISFFGNVLNKINTISITPKRKGRLTPRKAGMIQLACHFREVATRPSPNRPTVLIEKHVPKG